MKVYPVEGRFLADVPHVEHDCDEPEKCVESGAFTTRKPPPAKAEPETNGPPDGGPSDSEV